MDEDRINLQLGDIIEIQSPSDEVFHNKRFLITYIDQRQIHLLSVNKEKHTLIIEDNSLKNESIESIIIRTRNTEKGFALQNGLLVGTWVDIRFDFNIPIIVTGKIVNLEEDQIEIKTVENKNIFIDFGYKGIPLSIPITEITIRSEPSKLNEEKKEDEEKQEEVIDDPSSVVTLNEKDTVLQEFKQADTIEFGQKLGVVKHLVELPESKQRYGIEKQIGDILDEMLSTIPNHERTPEILNEIHQMIERFKELRKEFSDFDANMNATMKSKRDENYRPLIDSLKGMKHKLAWIIPVVKFRKKLYDVDDEIDLEKDVEKTTLAKTYISETEIVDEYFDNNISTSDNKYSYMQRRAKPYSIPFIDVGNTFYNITINNSIFTLVDNLGSFYSSVSKENDIKRKRFLTQEFIEGDQMSLVSYMMLPEPVIQYSKINLPSSSILTRTDFNLNNLSYWKFLKKNTEITNVTVDETHVEDKSTMFEVLKNYIPSDGQQIDKYLEKTIPDIISISEKYKNNLTGNISLHAFVHSLEPFLIYQNDLSQKDYFVILEIIKDEIKKLKERIETSVSSLSGIVPNTSEFEDTMHKLIEVEYDSILKAYDLSKIYTNSEVYSKTMLYDYGKLYNSALANSSISLMINQVERLANTSPNGRIVAKEYTSLEELEVDNEKMIYFDKSKDPTYYELYEDHKDYLEGMTENDKINFLSKQLQTDAGISEYYANIEAQYIIDGKRKIQNGDYAFVNSEKKYYKRLNKRWEQELQIHDDNSEISFDKFDQTLEILNKEVSDNFKKIILNATKRLPYISQILKHDKYKYDFQKHNIGMLNGDISGEYSFVEKLRDLILGQNDFIKKQNDILNFVKLFTREPMEEESEWWLYDLSTDMKLLPRFLKQMADAYFEGDYINIVDKICRVQGTLSDDESFWVDKYSGYRIVPIAFDTKEGYTDDGFKQKTRDVLEKDFNIVRTLPNEVKYTNSFAIKINNISSAIFLNIGINIDTHIEFIIQNSLKLIERIIPSQDKHASYVKKAKSSGKKRIDSYEDIIDKTIIIVTLSYILVSIQTSIPGAVTRKRHPGCIRSFKGYPYGKEDDLTGITYLACVANKLKSSIVPWKAIERENEKGLVKQIQSVIKSKILKESLVNQKIAEKRNYEENNDEFVPEELKIENWFNFLPLLQTTNIGIVESVAENFMEDVLESLKKGNSKQHKYSEILKSKIIYFSLKIQELIQDTVQKHSPVLSNTYGEPFLENSCCQTGVNTLEYFINDNTDITMYNDNANNMVNILIDIQNISKAPILFNPSYTKQNYPNIVAQFSEEVVYGAFIFYCKFGTDGYMSENLRTICSEKPANFVKSDDIRENIQSLKEIGYNYTNSDLDILMQYVNKSNIFTKEISKISFSNIDLLRRTIQIMDDKNEETTSDIFKELFIKLLDTFEIGGIQEDTIEMRNMKNYLDSANNSMKSEIISFIEKRGASRKHIDFLNSIADFDDDQNYQYQHIYKAQGYMKKCISIVSKIIPNITINGVDQSNIHIPHHWNLSNKHETDIKNIVKKYYSKLKSFHDNAMIKEALIRFEDNVTNINIISKQTFFFSPIIKDGLMYHTIFEKRMTIMLFKHYLYVLFYEMMNLVTIIFSSSEYNDIVQGNKHEFERQIAALIITCLEILSQEKASIYFNYEKLMERIHRAKEKEKDDTVEYLRNKTDEERTIENEFKNYRLEKWSKGLQKGLRIYQADTYDAERGELEKQTLRDIQLGKNNMVTQMNRNIFEMDMIVDELTQQVIDEEVNNLEGLPEDDDYGDGRDGDEYF